MKDLDSKTISFADVGEMNNSDKSFKNHLKIENRVSKMR